MDRNFHTDDFERMLREKSDEFRMYPSKRIWHSVYNNIHPGHKWPSVAMCITLISALLLVGYLNTRNANSYTGIKKVNSNYQTISFNQIKPAQFFAPIIIADGTSGADPLIKYTLDNSNKFKGRESFKNSKSVKSFLFTQATPSNQQTIKLVEESPSLSINISSEDDLLPINSNDKKANVELTINNQPSTQEGEIYIKSQKELSTIAVSDLEQVNIGKETAETDNKSMAVKSIDHAVEIDLDSYSTEEFNNHEVGNKAAIQIDKIVSSVEQLKLASNKIVIVGTADKNWIDNYALYNRPAPKKWANKLGWQIYATPSVVYRTLNNSSAFGNTLNATPFAISSSNQNINSSVIQTPSLGLELGSGLNYLILKNVRIKGAFQLNFTRYNAHAFANSHPVATKLTMHNFETETLYEVYRSTAYSNNSGLESIKLHNETFQISLPVGVDLKLIGNERLQWNIGATIQPSFVAGGKSYLISSDRHNYVKETSMLTRWNFNAGFETFVSFKSNGLTWQIGPQFRKQLFTTNSKTFAVEEKLLNYGIKFGVSKTLK